jgi:hypothetical protein
MRLWIPILFAGLLAATSTPAPAAPNFVGQSGNLVTPNDLITPQGEFGAGYRYLDKNLFGSGDTMNVYSFNYGLAPRLEAGLAYVVRDSNRMIVNGKYQLLPERAGRPSLSLGVVDLFNQLKKNPGGYFLLGKDLSRASGDVRDETGGRPLHAYVGLGTGPYHGVLAGLSYRAAPQVALMAEYAPEGPLTGRRRSVNLGVRLALSNQIRIDAGLFDFDSIGVGISFTSGLRLGRL